MNFYDNLNAKNVFHFFEEISKIPRGPLTKKVSVIIYSYFALQKVHMNLENSILKSLGTVLFDHSHMFYYILRLIINKIIIKKNLPHSKITFIKLLSRFKLYLYANSQLRIKKNRPC